MTVYSESLFNGRISLIVFFRSQYRSTAVSKVRRSVTFRQS